MRLAHRIGSGHEEALRRLADCRGFAGERFWPGFGGGAEATVLRCPVEEDSSSGAAPAKAIVLWDVGIRRDVDIRYQDLLSRRSGKGFSSPGLAPAAE